MHSLCMRLICILALGLVPSVALGGAKLQAPTTVEAGQAFAIQTVGAGEASFYLLGPGRAIKRTIHLGSDIAISSDEVSTAGRYEAVICSREGCVPTTFEVRASTPARLSFFLHPSRVPVSTPDAIDATAFVFDRYYNLIPVPTRVQFQITGASGADSVRTLTAEGGIAWLRIGSSGKAGPLRVTAVLGDVKEPRVIQQVAAEACGLRMKATSNTKGTLVETDPVRDCNGNPLPDGTIVSFTSIDAAGKSTVDAPIKKGIARARFKLKGHSQISVACGVVLGNELSVTGSM